MGLKIDSTAADKLVYRIGATIKSSPARKIRALSLCIFAIERTVKQTARSGGLFSRRSKGVLAAKTHTSVGGDFALLLSGVKYGKIQDVGGTTGRHFIKPRNGSVLAWKTPDGMAFSQGHWHPGSRIPGVRYSQKAFEANQDFIERTIAVVAEVPK